MTEVLTLAAHEHSTTFNTLVYSYIQTALKYFVWAPTQTQTQTQTRTLRPSGTAQELKKQAGKEVIMLIDKLLRNQGMQPERFHAIILFTNPSIEDLLEVLKRACTNGIDLALEAHFLEDLKESTRAIIDEKLQTLGFRHVNVENRLRSNLSQHELLDIIEELNEWKRNPPTENQKFKLEYDAGDF